MSNFEEEQRLNMVEGQLLPDGIVDSDLLNALMSTPREEFVPEKFKHNAYFDYDIPINERTYIIKATSFANLVKNAEIQPNEKVMAIVSANGYYATILSKLAEKVIAVDEHNEITEQSRQMLKKMKVKNVEVVTSPRNNGHAAGAPYDVILIIGGVEQIPQVILNQLSEGGRLVTAQSENQIRQKNNGDKSASSMLDSQPSLARIVVYKRYGDNFAKSFGKQINIPRLSEFSTKKTFRFE